MSEKIIEIVAKQLKADAGQITGATNIMEDLGADSLDIVELLMALEEEFGVSVPDEDVQGLKTIKDITDYMEKNK
jgi:acyl carrier protein